MLILIVFLIILFLGFYVFIVKSKLNSYDFKIALIIQLMLLIIIWIATAKYRINYYYVIFDLQLIKINTLDLSIFIISFFTAFSLNYFNKNSKY